jgi:hypothetical protein
MLRGNGNQLVGEEHINPKKDISTYIFCCILIINPTSIPGTSLLGSIHNTWSTSRTSHLKVIGPKEEKAKRIA